MDNRDLLQRQQYRRAWRLVASGTLFALAFALAYALTR